MNNTNEESFFDEETLRDKYIKRVEVLDKVKEVILLPKTGFATQKQIAEYYEVELNTINMITNRNKKELTLDGYRLFKKADVIKELNTQADRIAHKVGKSIVLLDNGTELELPSRGLRLYPKRAILRLGMLLRDSEVAKEIRTYLLNIEEKSTEEDKKEEIIRIGKEDEILLKIINSKDKVSMAVGINEYKTYMQNEIDKRDINISALSTGNLTWDKRSAINRMARKLASELFKETGNYGFSAVYTKLKDEMLYKHKIHINRRIKNSDNKKATMYDVLSESEMSLLVKTCVALCNMYKVDIEDILIKE